MPYLGDYLGQLLSEISIARMHADLEAVRIAELYAAHPLLRTMPIPRMRLPEVGMEIPVLIKASEEPRAGESPRGGVPLNDMRQKFEEVLADKLTKAGLALSAAERRALRAALDERLRQFEAPNETLVNVSSFADDLTDTALRIIKERKPPRGLQEVDFPALLEDELRRTTRFEFLKMRTPPPRLAVLVTTAEIQAAGPTENVMRLRLKVSEEGVEWTVFETDGVRRDRLVPE